MIDEQTVFLDTVTASDYARQVAMNYKGSPTMSMVIDGYEFRYEQTGNRFRLQGFYGAPRINSPMLGKLSERPPWLVQILDVAAVAGALRHPVSPPDVILWFRTDRDYNLTEYVNL